MGWLNVRVKVSVVTAVPPPPALFCSTLPHLHHVPGSATPASSANLQRHVSKDGLQWFSCFSPPAPHRPHLLLQPLCTRLSCWPAFGVFPASHHQRYAHHSAPVLKSRTSVAHSPDRCLFSRSTFQHFVYCPFACVRFCLYLTCLCCASGKTCLPSVLDLRLPYNHNIACNMPMKVPTEIGIQGCVCVCVLDQTLLF